MGGQSYYQKPQVIKNITQYQEWISRYHLIREVPETPKTIQEIITAVGSTPELVGKALLPKTLQALLTGHKELRLDLDWKLPSSWLALRVPQVYGQQLYSVTGSVCNNPGWPGMMSQRHDGGKPATGGNNCFLVGFDTRFTGGGLGNLIWQHKPSQKPVAGEMIGCRGAATALVLNKHHRVPLSIWVGEDCLSSGH